VKYDLSASCCSSEESCHTEASEGHHQEPCGDTTCDCMCCGSISFVLLKKDIPEAKTLTDFQPISFSYKSLQGSIFHSMIWQPPRLG